MSTQRSEVEEAAPGSGLRGLIIPFTFFFLFFGVGAAQGFVVPYLTHEARGVSLFRARLLIALLYLAFGPCRFLASAVLRHVARKWVIVLGAVCYLAFPASLRFGHAYGVYLLGTLAIAFGAGLIWTASSTQVLDQAVRRKYGAASGVLYFFTKAGVALGALFLGWLVPASGVDYATFFRASLGIGAFAVALSLFVPGGGQPGARKDRGEKAMAAGDAMRLLFRDGNWVIPLIFGVSFASYGILLTTINSYAKAQLGERHVGWVLFSYYSAGVLFGYVGPWLSDRLGRKALLVAAFWGGGFAMLLLGFGSGAACIGLATALFGVQFGAMPGVVMAWVGDITTPSTRPTVHAATFLWRDLGGGGAALAAAYMSVKGLPATTCFRVFALLFFVTGVVAVWGMRRRGAVVRRQSGSDVDIRHTR